MPAARKETDWSGGPAGVIVDKPQWPLEIPVLNSHRNLLTPRPPMAAAEQWECEAHVRRDGFFASLYSMREIVGCAPGTQQLTTALRLASLLLHLTLCWLTPEPLYKALPSRATRGQSKMNLSDPGKVLPHPLRDFIQLYLFVADMSAEIYEPDYLTQQVTMCGPILKWPMEILSTNARYSQRSIAY